MAALTCGGRSSWTRGSGAAAAAGSASAASRSPSRACGRWPCPSSCLHRGNGVRTSPNSCQLNPALTPKPFPLLFSSKKQPSTQGRDFSVAVVRLWEAIPQGRVQQELWEVGNFRRCQRDAALTDAHVPALPPGQRVLPAAGAGVHGHGLADDQPILDQLPDLLPCKSVQHLLWDRQASTDPSPAGVGRIQCRGEGSPLLRALF